MLYICEMFCSVISVEISIKIATFKIIHIIQMVKMMFLSSCYRESVSKAQRFLLYRRHFSVFRFGRCVYVCMAMKTDVSRHIPHKAKTLNILMRRRRYFSLLAWEDISTVKRDKNCTVKTTAEYFSFPSFSRIWFAIYREESMLE